MINDEIVLLVCGGSTNAQVSRLVSVLQAAGCIGKVTSKKVSPEALREARAVIEKRKTTEERQKESAWR